VHNESSTKRRPTALGWRLGRKGRAALARVAPRLVWAPLDRLSLSASSANLLREALRDDSDRLRDFAGDDFPEWSV
ncbi:MAG TPA: hypothetical protein VM618_11025, partial [Acidimicrobiia bacterium]|nr:hypothetical protein [Acidimicrobiia bacterium]